MKPATLGVVALSSLAIAWAIQRSPDGFRDAFSDPSSLENVDTSQLKLKTGKPVKGPNISGVSVKMTSALAELECSGKVINIDLVDPDIQALPPDQWFNGVVAQIASDKQPVPSPIVLFHDRLKGQNELLDAPPTHFYNYLYQLGEDAVADTEAREDPHIRVNVFDTVRIFYKGTMVGSCDLIGHESTIYINQTSPIRVGSLDGVVIEAHDADRNLYARRKDRLPIHVYSDSDKKGIKVEAIETGDNTGAFVVQVLLKTGPSEGYSLKAKPGDNIYAVYFDKDKPERGRTAEEKYYAKVVE